MWDASSLYQERSVLSKSFTGSGISLYCNRRVGEGVEMIDVRSDLSYMLHDYVLVLEN